MGVRVAASSSSRSLRHRPTLAVAEGVVTCCNGRSTSDDTSSTPLTAARVRSSDVNV